MYASGLLAPGAEDKACATVSFSVGSINSLSYHCLPADHTVGELKSQLLYLWDGSSDYVLEASDLWLLGEKGEMADEQAIGSCCLSGERVQLFISRLRGGG